MSYVSVLTYSSPQCYPPLQYTQYMCVLVPTAVPIQSVSVSGSGNFGVGSTLYLWCQVLSGTRDTYQWYHNGALLNTSTSSYVKSAELNDSGSYRCEACNWAGCTSSSSYTVNVTGLFMLTVLCHLHTSIIVRVCACVRACVFHNWYTVQ